MSSPRPPSQLKPNPVPFPSRWAAMAAIGVFGLIMGLVTGTLLYGQQIERLNLQNRQLEEDLATLKEDNERLRTLPQGPARPIRELSLRFLALNDERVRLELNRQIRNVLADHIIGVPVTDLDPLLAARIVEGRLFPLEDTLWRVEVVGAYLIWETFILYVRIHREGEVSADPVP